MPVAVEAETLPTVDLRRFDGHASERSRFLEELRTAARSVGFFYLVGHGIEDGLIRDVLKVSRRFFALPEKDKLAIEMVNSPHFRGYNRAGFEHIPISFRAAWLSAPRLPARSSTIPPCCCSMSRSANSIR